MESDVQMRTGLSLARLAPILLLFSRPASATCVPVDHDHGAWTTILGRFVRDGEVDYRGLQREGAPLLASYLDSLSSTCADDYERWTRAERLTFWINAYNAFTVKLVVDHYPIASIRRIGWLPGAAFREPFVPMPGLKGGSVSCSTTSRTARSGPTSGSPELTSRSSAPPGAAPCSARGVPRRRPDRQLETRPAASWLTRRRTA